MKRFLVLLLVVGLGLAVADLTVSHAVATVNGTAISQSSLDAQLVAVADSPQYRCFLGVTDTVDGQVGAPFDTAKVDGVGGSGSYSSAFARLWLGQMIGQVLVDQVLAVHHVTVTAAELARARTELNQSYAANQHALSAGGQVTLPPQCEETSPPILSSIPASLAAPLTADVAAHDALETALPVTPAEERQYYQANPSEFLTYCVQGFTADTVALADALRTTLATATGLASETAAQGAAAAQSCYSPQSTETSQQAEQDYAVVKRYATGLARGQSSAPFSNGTAEVVLYLDKVTLTPLAQVRPEIDQALEAGGVTPTELALSAALRQAQVSVDPRYGSWIPTQGDLSLATPAPRFVVNPAANVPTVPVPLTPVTVPPSGSTPAPTAGTSNGG